MTEEPRAAKAQPTEEPSPAAGAKTAVNRGRLIVLGLIVFCLAWYLLADRYTPTTSQARIEAYVVGVAPNTSGLVTEIWVQNNEMVEAGQRLFQIDRSPYEIALSKAESDLATAYRQFEAGDASVDAAKAQLLAAQANKVRAEEDATRLQRLHDQDPGTISQRRLDVAIATLAAAEAQVTAAEASIRQTVEQMGGEDDSDNAKLKAARSAVEKARLDLDNTTVNASRDGIVTDLSADVGRYAGTGSPVLTLISMHDVWISAEFTENNLGHLRAGSRVEILFDVRPGKVYPGRVRSIGLGVGTGQAPPAPGTLPTIKNDRDWLRQAQRFPVEVEFDPAADATLAELLRVGGQATVIGYTDGVGPLNLLGKLYIRVMSVLSYAY